MTNLLSSERLEGVARLLWGLVLLTLPVTSFRYFPGLFGASQMRPLALYPLALLLFTLLILAWKKREVHFPPQIIPLIAFLLFAVIATALGLLDPPIPMRGQTLLKQALRDWVTISVGLAFFVGALGSLRDDQRVARSLPWLYAGLAASILWGSIQAIAINTPILSEDLISDLQLTFSIRPLINRRISGFAFEPAWLADQINLLYLPWLGASLITGRRATRWPWLEWVLLIGALFLLLLTYSRSGIGATIVVSAIVLLLTGGRFFRRAWEWLREPFGARQAPGMAIRVLLVFAIVLSLLGAFAWLNSYPYFARLWGEFNLDRGIVNYLVKINSGPRAAAAIAGLGVFAEKPWTGVGLGGSGLLLYDHYPDWIYNFSIEVTRQLSPDSKHIPNIKNLYIRLLAETGIIGFWLFAAFLLSVLGRVRELLRGEGSARFVGIAALFIWLAVALRNFTQDSFTFPLMWVGLGMILGYRVQSSLSSNIKDQ
jgi:O-antigen ligase